MYHTFTTFYSFISDILADYVRGKDGVCVRKCGWVFLCLNILYCILDLLITICFIVYYVLGLSSK